MVNSKESSTFLALQEKRSALAIFCRAPRLGSVKTRLAQTRGDEFALQLYRAMLADSFDLGRALAPDVETFACFTPADAFEDESLHFLWNGPRIAQCEGDLGTKILDCFAQLRAQGFERIVIIGSDSPDLPLQYLRESFAALQNHDFVFGPSIDGGFYLMGASLDFSAPIFADVIWSSSRTLPQIETNLRRFPQKMKRTNRCHRLPPWRDVDDAEDLKDLERRLFQLGTGAPQSRNFLQFHKK
ncbi:hypothetical protein B1R32_106155 [Abditibacterium utsteinense]|uniref:Glycosyltransferase n=1 Tax=Abditibacterium utsteinense TaxID=1960156 RepID=A0A2S8SU78_9BACT|nr:TIGR04282 family arsenosugar biosynthesis glycosyltransferase [Abditibacterium utsteinense]PQV64309.1 hypothetical protein B1R32_106155 [Abditibacterium utsteinense]